MLKLASSCMHHFLFLLSPLDFELFTLYSGSFVSLISDFPVFRLSLLYFLLTHHFQFIYAAQLWSYHFASEFSMALLRIMLCIFKLFFILFLKKSIWRHWVLVVAHGIFHFVTACRIFSCCMWDLVLTRDWIQTLYIGVQSLSHWTTREVLA